MNYLRKIKGSVFKLRIIFSVNEKNKPTFCVFKGET